MVPCAILAIVLGPTRNLQGAYKFLNLETGKKIKCCSFTSYQLPDLVITKVVSLGHMNLPGVLNLADRNGVLFKWNKEFDWNAEVLVEEDVTL
jgi:hypothetical protein